MQPSQLEIEREVEALRDIRRRSTAQGGPGSLILDPDLPSETSQQQAAYWSPDDSSSSSHDSQSEDSSVSAHDDPFHLFWVPARVHPELAPKEFKEFLQEHARADSTTAGVGRSNSVASVSSSLGRKKSMLSRQYDPLKHPEPGDKDEHVVPLRRNRTSIYANVPQLTISDLQKLEELAEEASKSDDPTKLRSALRRSLSLNIAPSVIDQMDDLRDPGEDVDSPIIIPPPNQILRRSARTKIRKAGTGEGAHRFTATRSRRKSLVVRAATMEPRSSSDLSSSDHGDVDTIRRVKPSDDDIPAVPPLPRPESYSVETSIYDAYANEDAEHDLSTEPPPLSRSPDIVAEPVAADTPTLQEPEPETGLELEDVLESSAAPVIPALYHPQPQRALAPPSESPIPQRTPSPSTPDLTTSPSTSESTHYSRPSLQGGPAYHPPSPSPSERSEQRREKDKKGLFGKWGGDKNSKKHKEKEHREREKEKEKDGSFFGSLFGSKKKQEEPQSVANTSAGRETAAALLGASKSTKNYVPPPSPQLGSYARYPIHVERAIYRLSHIKLANPRRPLYEQVLISNLMFWYLGVINKTQAQGQGQGQNGATSPVPGQTGGPPSPSPADKERAEKEQEERERAEREREKKEGSRKGSLTKPVANGAPGSNVRRAETPVRGPQYEMQHRAMEQGYGGYGQPPGGGGPPPTRTSSAPPPPMQNAPRGSPQSSQYSVQLVQPQPRPAGSPGTANSQYYEIGEPSTLSAQQYPLVVTGAPQLPPGAMPPVAVEQTWIANAGSQGMSLPSNRSSNSPPPRSASGSPPTSPNSPGSRRPRSPPSTNRYTPAQEKQPYSGVGVGGGARLPGRSLSATAAPPQPMAPMNGKVKKVMSAHAVPPRQSSEDEDLPLAMWQQQQRRKEY
ncbi:hypothetical protein C2E23DRAFT_861636 [Lenzites betulinus]|nr:hypothetical protein C2E23DRAFT_861636 [Lenzites betulinus]